MTHKLTIGIAVALAIAVVAYFILIPTLFGGQAAPVSPADQQAQSGMQLIAQDEEVGTGPVAAVGDTVTVDYVGKLQDGTVFDSTSGKTPFTFPLGAGKVIPGWDQGLQGMKVGGKRLLIIPPQLGYGSQAVGPIPANATLVFEVTLLDVATPTAAPVQAQ